MAVPPCVNGRRCSTTSTRHVLWYLAVALFCLVLGDAIKPTDAQAYHFSKGWMPGRKRATSAAVMSSVGGGHDSVESGPGASAALIEAVRRAVYGGGDNKESSPSTAAVCAIRSRVYRLVLDMIREGFERLDDTCALSVSHGMSATAAADLDGRASYLRQHVANYEKSASDD